MAASVFATVASSEQVFLGKNNISFGCEVIFVLVEF
jgi:hypothetical protein